MKLIGLLVGLTVTLSACSTAPYTAADAAVDAPVLTEKRRLYMLSELEQQRNLWAETTPQKYSYEIENICFCFPVPVRGPHEIIVENDVILSRIYLGKTRDGYETGVALSDGLGLRNPIEGMFASIEKYLNPVSEPRFGSEVKVYFTVEYDAVLGFPTKIYSDVEDVYDIQDTLIVKNFKVIE